jgi:hypothetical protein
MINANDPRFGLTAGVMLPEASPPASSAAKPRDGREDAIEEAFDQLVRDVIRPEMEGAGTKLERSAHQYEIVIEPGQRITMRMCAFLDERRTRAAGCPCYLTFSRDASSASIHVAQGTLRPDGQEGGVITWTLPALRLTRAEVARLILDTLEIPELT